MKVLKAYLLLFLVFCVVNAKIAHIKQLQDNINEQEKNLKANYEEKIAKDHQELEKSAEDEINEHEEIKSVKSEESLLGETNISELSDDDEGDEMDEHPFGELDALIQTAKDPEVSRKKKSATTTFCVEIRPSSPDQKPFQVCDSSGQNQQPYYQQVPATYQTPSKPAATSAAHSTNPTYVTPIKAYSSPAQPQSYSQPANGPAQKTINTHIPYGSSYRSKDDQIETSDETNDKGSMRSSEDMLEREEETDEKNSRSAYHSGSYGSGYAYPASSFSASYGSVAETGTAGSQSAYLPVTPHQTHSIHNHNGLVITCQPNLAGYAHNVPSSYNHPPTATGAQYRSAGMGRRYGYGSQPYHLYPGYQQRPLYPYAQYKLQPYAALKPVPASYKTSSYPQPKPAYSQLKPAPAYQQPAGSTPTYQKPSAPAPIYQQQAQTYQQPAPTYQHQAPTYQQTAPPVPTYQQPAAPTPTYQPAPSPEQTSYSVPTPTSNKPAAPQGPAYSSSPVYSEPAASAYSQPSAIPPASNTYSAQPPAYAEQPTNSAPATAPAPAPASAPNYVVYQEPAPTSSYAPSSPYPSPAPAPTLSYQPPASSPSYASAAPAPAPSYAVPAAAPVPPYGAPAPATAPSYPAPAPGPTPTYSAPPSSPNYSAPPPAPAPAPAPPSANSYSESAPTAYQPPVVPSYSQSPGPAPTYTPPGTYREAADEMEQASRKDDDETKQKMPVIKKQRTDGSTWANSDLASEDMERASQNEDFETSRKMKEINRQRAAGSKWDNDFTAEDMNMKKTDNAEKARTNIAENIQDNTKIDREGTKADGILKVTDRELTESYI